MSASVMATQIKLLRVSLLVPTAHHTSFVVLKRKDSEGKLMFHIALLNGSFKTAIWLLQEWP